jgi:hypothetical protein
METFYAISVLLPNIAASASSHAVPRRARESVACYWCRERPHPDTVIHYREDDGDAVQPKEGDSKEEGGTGASSFSSVRLDRFAEALMLILELLAKLIDLRLKLSKCRIGIFKGLLVLLLLVQVDYLYTIQVT